MRNRQQGMTLVELLLAFLLSVAALGVGILVIAAAVDTIANIELKQAHSAEAKVALERLSRELNQASSYTLTQTTLTLAIDGSEILWQLQEIDETPYLLHGTAEQIEANARAQIIASHITGISASQTEEQTSCSLTLNVQDKEFTLTKTTQAIGQTLP